MSTTQNCFKQARASLAGSAAAEPASVGAT